MNARQLAEQWVSDNASCSWHRETDSVARKAFLSGFRAGQATQAAECNEKVSALAAAAAHGDMLGNDRERLGLIPSASPSQPQASAAPEPVSAAQPAQSRSNRH